MARNNKMKKNKGIVVLLIAIVALAAFAYLILYNGNVVVKKTETTEVINKLKYIKVTGGDFELVQKDLDEISNIYFQKPINKKGVTLQGVNINILKNELLIEAPIKYNNVDLLVSSKGKMSLSNGEVVYTPDNFKIGKLTMPKSLVISQLKKQQNNIFYVEGNLIKIKPDVLPIKIEKLKIIDNKILGTAEKPNINMLIDNLNKGSSEEVDKQLATLEQKLQSAIVFMNDEQKEKMKQIQSTIDDVKNKSVQEKKKVLSDIINKINKTIGESKNR